MAVIQCVGHRFKGYLRGENRYRHTVPSTAKPAPMSDEYRGPAPASIGSPPHRAPMALPRLNAICIMAPPISSAPGEYLISISCIGGDMAKSAVAARHTSDTAAKTLHEKRYNPASVTIRVISMIRATLTGVYRSLNTPP